MPTNYRVVQDFKSHPGPLIQVHVIYPTSKIGETMWLAQGPLTPLEIQETFKEAVVSINKLKKVLQDLQKELEGDV